MPGVHRANPDNSPAPPWRLPKPPTPRAQAYAVVPVRLSRIWLRTSRPTAFAAKASSVDEQPLTATMTPPDITNSAHFQVLIILSTGTRKPLD